MTDYTSLVTRYVMALENRMQAEQAEAAARRELVEYMEANQRKTVSAETPYGKRKVTYSRSTRITIDEKGLKKAIGAKLFNKFTVRKLDRAKLEKALDEGVVSPNTVSPYVKESYSTPYLRVTGVKDDADRPA